MFRSTVLVFSIVVLFGTQVSLSSAQRSRDAQRTEVEARASSQVVDVGPPYRLATPGRERTVDPKIVVLGLTSLSTAMRQYSAREISTGASMPFPMSSVQLDSSPLTGAHTIQQLSSNRHLDAHDTVDQDFAVVTRPRQNNATQRWIFRYEGGRIYTIQQQNTGRFLDAHDTADRDFAVVTRPKQENTTQRWLVTHVRANVYAIQQSSTRRFLDAHETAERDFAVVTRLQQTNQQSSETQRWIIR